MSDPTTREELVAEALRLLDLANAMPVEATPDAPNSYSAEDLSVLRELEPVRRPAGHVEDRPSVECRPGMMGGRPVFRGTRVQIECLFENLADGLPLGEILDSYPTLDRSDCQAALMEACGLLGEAAREDLRDRLKARFSKTQGEMAERWLAPLYPSQDGPGAGRIVEVTARVMIGTERSTVIVRTGSGPALVHEVREHGHELDGIGAAVQAALRDALPA